MTTVVLGPCPYWSEIWQWASMWYGSAFLVPLVQDPMESRYRGLNHGIGHFVWMSIQNMRNSLSVTKGVRRFGVKPVKTDLSIQRGGQNDVPETDSGRCGARRDATHRLLLHDNQKPRCTTIKMTSS